MRDFENPSLYSDEELVEEMKAFERLYETVINKERIREDIKRE